MAEELKITISRDDFERYENVRKSGRTNMFMINNVMALSGLCKAKVFYIMRNYCKIKEDLRSGK